MFNFLGLKICLDLYLLLGNLGSFNKKTQLNHKWKNG